MKLSVFPSGFWVVLCLAVAVLGARGEDILRVSTFSTILTEVAQKVGGDRVVVTGHVPVGVDPHEFEPNPGVLKSVSASNLVLLSAKHMEGYVGKLQQVMGAKVKVLEVGAQIPSLWLGEGAGKEKAEDPHWWQSLENMQRAVRVVRDEFVKLRPGSGAVFEANAAAYTKDLDALQRWVRGRISELPKNRRKLVTSHDAFQYFAREYGFTIYSVEGLTHSDQPSSRKVVELLNVIREQRVKAVFSEDAANPKVLQQITAETGAVLGGQLWADGLGPGQASTYDGMFRQNVNAIVDGLK